MFCIFYSYKGDSYNVRDSFGENAIEGLDKMHVMSCIKDRTLRVCVCINPCTDSTTRRTYRTTR